MALTPPPDPEEGEQVLPWARAIGRLIRQIIPRESADIWPNITSTGTSYLQRKRPRTDDVSGRANVFDFTLSPATQDGPAVTLGFGNVDSDGSITFHASVNPYPSEFSGSNTPPWTDTKIVGDAWFAYIIVTVDSDPAGDGTAPPVITDVSWDIFTETQNPAYPTADDSTGTYYFLVGNGDIDSGQTRIANAGGKGSLTFGYCGGAGFFSPAGPAAIPS